MSDEFEAPQLASPNPSAVSSQITGACLRLDGREEREAGK
jgi:hypothetical protein